VTAAELLARLEASDIRLWADRERLRFNAPAGAMTPALRATVAEHRDELLRLLGARAAPEETAAGDDRDGPVPLSPAQDHLWRFLEATPPARYNKPLGAMVDGPLDVAALERCVAEVARRHQVLRTTFRRGEDGTVHQVAGELPALPFALADLTALPEAERDAELRRLTGAEVEHEFDLERGPIFRVLLARLGAERHVLVVSMHPLAWDGWSRMVFVRELVTLYAAALAGYEAPLPALPVQYADHAFRERAWLRGGEAALLAAQGREALRDLPPSPALPPGAPRPAHVDFRGVQHEFALPAGVESAVADLARRAGVTQHMTYLAAYLVLLRTMSDLDDIVVGAPVANRARRETAGLIGLFVNTAVVRTSLAGDPGFRDLLARVRAATTAAYARQELPLGVLGEHVVPGPDGGRGRLFQVLFDLIESAASMPEVAGLRLAPVTIENGRADCDLSLGLYRLPDGVQGILVGAAWLFDTADLALLAASYADLLVAVTGDPDRRLSELRWTAGEGGHHGT
jgi:hypothetical protein